MPLNLTTPIGRIRFAVGDHLDGELLLEGGASQYTRVLAQVGGDEVAAFRAVAGALAAFYAAQPTRLSTSGKSVDYSDRVPLWRAQADGESLYPFSADGSAVAPGVAPGRSARVGQLTAGTNQARNLR